MHDVEPIERRVSAGERRWDDRKVLGDVVGDAEGRERATRDQHLLADLDHLDELGRVGVEVDHVTGFFRGLRTGIHRYGHVGLRQRRGIVGAIATHGDQAAVLLMLTNQRQLRLGRGLGQEVIDARLGGDRRRRELVVAGDHDGADAHAAQLREALANAGLDDVLEFHHAERARSATTNGVAPWRATLSTARCTSGGRAPPCSVSQRSMASAAPLRMRPPSKSTPLMRVCALKGMNWALSARISRPRMPCSCLASTTIERPSGVSSASEDSCAASANSSVLTPGAGMKRDARRLPSVIVPVLSSSSTSTSPAASTARPEVAMTLAWIMRSMPAMPIADSRPPIVVGIRHTSNATSTVIEIGVP